MIDRNNTGLTPEQYKALEILTSYGMKIAIVDRHTNNNNPRRAKEQIFRDASLSLTKLETFDSKKVVVGITGTGVDAFIRDPEIQSSELTEIESALPEVLAKMVNPNGTETYFVKSTGLPNMAMPGIEFLTENQTLVLPSPGDPNGESAQWLSMAQSPKSNEPDSLKAAVEKLRIQSAKDRAAERKLHSERVYVERRKVEVVTSKASKLNKSIKRVRSTKPRHKFDVASKQCYSLGHFTDNDPQLNELIVDAMVKEVLFGNSFTGSQIREIIERLNASLKAGIAHQEKVGQR